ncbi:hypothetical protein HK102_002484 [Quaeritorhiza haematococci]|nr:hypothetical protein HK102_002484 [Quaeritorhiza haematococci]
MGGPLDRRVVLNIGGVHYETFVGTFMRFPDSLLGAMFAPRNSMMLRADEEGEFFFDRNGKTFEFIPSNVSLDSVREEMEYFGLDPPVPARTKRSSALTHNLRRWGPFSSSDSDSDESVNSTHSFLSSTSPSSPTTISYLVERTLQILSDARSCGYDEFTVEVDQEGTCSGVPLQIQRTSGQKRFWSELGRVVSGGALLAPELLDDYELALKERFSAVTGLGTCMEVKEVRKTLFEGDEVDETEEPKTGHDPGDGAESLEKRKEVVDFISHWEVIFKMPKKGQRRASVTS